PALAAAGDHPAAVPGGAAVHPGRDAPGDRERVHDRRGGGVPAGQRGARGAAVAVPDVLRHARRVRDDHLPRTAGHPRRPAVRARHAPAGRTLPAQRPSRLTCPTSARKIRLMTRTAFGEITEGAPPPAEMEQLADKLVAFARAASRLDLDDVPQSTRDHAALVIADTLGVIKAGSEQPEFRALMADAHGLFGHAGGGEAQTAFDPERRVSPVAAAFMNGAAGNAPELNELIEGGGM